MTSYTLKVIALIFMTIDHIGAVLGQSGIAKLFTGLSPQTTVTIYVILRALGRISFPLFAYTMALSVHKTSSLPKFIGRLLMFAFISEPFYYLATHVENFSIRTFFPAFFASLLNFKFTNVFFTFVIGAAVVLVYKKLESKGLLKRWLIFVPVLVLALALAMITECNYGMRGVLLVVALYIVPTTRLKLAVISLWAVTEYMLVYIIKGLEVDFTVITWIHIIYTLCAIASCAFIASSNGERGKPAKWGFYVYYPLHLFVISLVSLFVHYYSGFLW